MNRKIFLRLNSALCRWLLAVGIIAGNISGVSLFAETVSLRDGSVVTGSVKSNDGEIIKFETKYGMLAVKTDDILTSDFEIARSTNALKVEIQKKNPDTNGSLEKSKEESSSNAGPRKLAVGISYTGGGVRYDINDKRALEIRYLVGKDKNDSGDVSSDVVSVRGYEFIPQGDVIKLFTGTELAYLTGKQKGTSYATVGLAVGVFGGLELRVSNRIRIGVDIGPYMFWLQEKQTRGNASSLEFVANSYLNYYLF